MNFYKTWSTYSWVYSGGHNCSCISDEAALF